MVWCRYVSSSARASVRIKLRCLTSEFELENLPMADRWMTLLQGELGQIAATVGGGSGALFAIVLSLPPSRRRDPVRNGCWMRLLLVCHRPSFFCTPCMSGLRTKSAGYSRTKV